MSAKTTREFADCEQRLRHLHQRELALRWNLSPRTLERWRWLGQGPRYLKLGRRVAYRLEDVEAFEAAQSQSGAAGEDSDKEGEHDVALLAHGQTSSGFLPSASAYIASLQVPAHISNSDDFAPARWDAVQQIKASLRWMTLRPENGFERLAVVPVQIPAESPLSWSTEASYSAARAFGELSLELDAIKPRGVPEIVQATTEWHLPAEELRVLTVAQKSERNVPRSFVKQVRGDELMEHEP